jgi:hypothetical protein
LNPLGFFLNPMGLFLRASITFIYLHTVYRTCFSQVWDKRAACRQIVAGASAPRPGGGA